MSVRWFNTIYADPAWAYRDKLDMRDGVRRAAADHYETMTPDAVMRYPYEAPSSFPGPRNLWSDFAQDSILFLCVTNPILLDGVGQRVCEAWGYKPKALITWVKGREVERHVIYRMGLGSYTRGVTEHVILATRGECGWLIKDHGVLNYLETNDGMAFLGQVTQHSRKPKELYDLIERLASGPYLELFARQRREGWTSIGDQLPAETV